MKKLILAAVAACLLMGSAGRAELGTGVLIQTDHRLKFPIPSATDLPLVKEGKATLTELLNEGEKNWYFGAPLEGEPFGVPEPLFNAFFGAAGSPLHGAKIRAFQWVAHPGLVYVPGEDLPRGLVRTSAEGYPLVTQNCSACHSGVVNGHLIPGIANKWYDQKSIIGFSRLMMEATLPVLKLFKEHPLAEQTEQQLAKLNRYDALYGTGCSQLAPGMITAARIWQISSKLLHDPGQLLTPAGSHEFLCGETKPPAMNTLRFRNIYFWDGSVNTLWVAHWPMFDFFGFDDYSRWEVKTHSREIQSIDAFLEFGTKSPAWGEVMKTKLDPARAARGYRIFHRENSCVSCHGTYAPDGMLLSFRPNVTPLNVIGTDSGRSVAADDTLMRAFAKYGWADVPRLEGMQKDYPPGYQAYPLCSTFLNYPYLHTAGVANLHELLLPEEKRSRSYWLSDSVDEANVGFYTSRWELLKHSSFWSRSVHREFEDRYVRGHSGPRFGTDLGEQDRLDLIEYLKTLRCP